LARRAPPGGGVIGWPTCCLVPHSTCRALNPPPLCPRRHKQQWEAAHASNQQQLARKAAEAEAQRAADRAFCAAWGERLQQLRAEEQQEAADARARALEVQRFQGWQVRRRAARAEEAKRADVQAALMAQAAVEGVEADFGAHATGVRDEAARRGLPLGPIDRLLAAKDSPLAASL
jgi:hypothetical protein